MTTWSSNSRRTLPIHRSATPFCHGLLKAVLVGWMPNDFIVETTCAEKIESRSKIT
jgi:hypothetical protein